MTSFFTYVSPTYSVALFVMKAIAYAKEFVYIALVTANVVNAAFIKTDVIREFHTLQSPEIRLEV
jgi:hypothetical protein